MSAETCTDYILFSSMQFLQMQHFDCITTTSSCRKLPSHIVRNAHLNMLIKQVEMFMCRCNWGKWAFFMSLSLNELPQWSSQLIPPEGKAEPDFTKSDMFLDQHLCWPWNNIVINQSDLKNQFCFLWSLGLQSVYISTLYACTSVSFIYHFLWF